MLQVYSARLCPFAQRVRSLLLHLQLEHEVIEVDLAQRDPVLLERSPTGRVPLLIDDAARGFDEEPLALYESAVVSEYLIELGSWERAYAPSRAVRYLERLAMARFDALMVPMFYRGMRNRNSLGAEELDELRGDVRRLADLIELLGGEIENAMAFHMAPFWARIFWMGSHAPVLSVLLESDIVRFWLDRCLEISAIARTLPVRDELVASYRQRFVGVSGNG